jgi:hypothetical protein
LVSIIYHIKVQKLRIEYRLISNQIQLALCQGYGHIQQKQAQGRKEKEEGMYGYIHIYGEIPTIA